MKQTCLLVISVSFTLSFINGRWKIFFALDHNFNKNIFLQASPLQTASSEHRRRQRSNAPWKQPEDNWNITSIPRSILPHLENKNFTHSLPAPGNIQLRVIDADERMLERFHEIKASLFKTLLVKKYFMFFFAVGKCFCSNIMGKVGVSRLALLAFLR